MPYLRAMVGSGQNMYNQNLESAFHHDIFPQKIISESLKDLNFSQRGRRIEETWKVMCWPYNWFYRESNYKPPLEEVSWCIAETFTYKRAGFITISFNYPTKYYQITAVVFKHVRSCWVLQGTLIIAHQLVRRFMGLCSMYRIPHIPNGVCDWRRMRLQTTNWVPGPCTCIPSLSLWRITCTYMHKYSCIWKHLVHMHTKSSTCIHITYIS